MKMESAGTIVFRILFVAKQVGVRDMCGDRLGIGTTDAEKSLVGRNEVSYPSKSLPLMGRKGILGLYKKCSPLIVGLRPENDPPKTHHTRNKPSQQTVIIIIAALAVFESQAFVTLSRYLSLLISKVGYILR